MNWAGAVIHSAEGSFMQLRINLVRVRGRFHGENWAIWCHFPKSEAVIGSVMGATCIQPEAEQVPTIFAVIAQVM